MKLASRIVGVIMATFTTGLIIATSDVACRGDIGGTVLLLFMASCFCYFTYMAFSYKD